MPYSLQEQQLYSLKIKLTTNSKHENYLLKLSINFLFVILLSQTKLSDKQLTLFLLHKVNLSSFLNYETETEC